MTAERSFYGAVEAGGTKFVCAIGDVLGNMHVEERFPTADPTSTLAIALAF
jgi:fructokinase